MNKNSHAYKNETDKGYTCSLQLMTYLFTIHSLDCLGMGALQPIKHFWTLCQFPPYCHMATFPVLGNLFAFMMDCPVIMWSPSSVPASPESQWGNRKGRLQVEGTLNSSSILPACQEISSLVHTGRSNLSACWKNGLHIWQKHYRGAFFSP